MNFSNSFVNALLLGLTGLSGIVMGDFESGFGVVELSFSANQIKINEMEERNDAAAWNILPPGIKLAFDFKNHKIPIHSA